MRLHKVGEGGADMFTTICLGIWIGVLVGTFLPEWIRIVVFLITFWLSDLVHSASHDVSYFHSLHYAVPPWLIGIVGVLVGMWAWHSARRRGLAHLGQSELNTRWTNVRRISKWGW